MNVLLLAFAIPVATILLSIVLQKILKCPLLVAATFFAVLLIVTFTVSDLSFLVFAIIYTILAYVTSVLTRFICNLISTTNVLNTNEGGCSASNDSNTGNRQIIVLTNDNNANNNIRRNGRNCCNCNRR